MKTTMSLVVAATLAVFAVHNVYAGMERGESRKPLLFSLDTGDGSPANMLVFDNEETEAQSTCAMTPNGTGNDVILEVPPEPQPVRDAGYDAGSSSAAMLRGTPPSNPNYPPYRPRTPLPPTENPPEKDPPPMVPEPATLLMLGLGIAGAVLVRRHGR